MANTSRCQSLSGACSSRNNSTSRIGSAGKERLSSFSCCFCCRSRDCRSMTSGGLMNESMYPLEGNLRSYCFLFLLALFLIRWSTGGGVRLMCGACASIRSSSDRHASMNSSTASRPVTIAIAVDAGRVVGHLVEHLAVGAGKPGIVFEEIAVPVDVGDDQLLVEKRIGLQQIGVTRVGVDHHLVDFLQAVRVALGQLVVLGPEPPVRIPQRETRRRRPACSSLRNRRLRRSSGRNRDRSFRARSSISSWAARISGGRLASGGVRHGDSSSRSQHLARRLTSPCPGTP